MPQTNYTFPDAVARAGMLATARDADHAKIDSRLYEAAFDTWTATVGGTAANGIYSFDVDGVTVEFDRQAAETNAQIAVALTAAGEAETALDNVANFTDPSTAVTGVAAVHAGDKLDVENPVAPGGATLVLANTVDSDKADLRVGIFVVRDGERGVRAPTTGDVDGDILGVSMIGEASLRDNSGEPLENDGFKPTTMVPVVRECDGVWMVVEDAVSQGDDVFCRVVATGSETAGAPRSDADGGDAVQVTGAKFQTDAAAGELVQVRLNRP